MAWVPRSVRIIVIALALGVASVTGARASRGGGVTQVAFRRLSSVLVHRCPDGEPGWCGSVRRPLDPGLPGGPLIPISFEWISASSGHVRGTVVAVEGGPGYPSTGSVGEYEGTFGPLLKQRNLLLVDNRGTGGSAVISCGPLDRVPVGARASGPAFDQIVGDCGAALNHRYRTADGTFVHASDLFGTAYAVADLRVVLRRLGLRRIDLYGDSYGSWFAQAFMARYPDVLRSVILDSTYATRHLDPYYASSGSSGRTALNLVCERDPGCTATTHGRGTAVSRLARLLTEIRRTAPTGSVPGPHGRHVTVQITPRHLVDLVQNAGSDPIIWRDLDASVRAALAGDDVPLLRVIVDGGGNGGSLDPGYFSDGAYMAVSCSDYPQLFSVSAPVARRRSELKANVIHARAGAFAPFTPAEWVQMSGYSETYDACLDWPRPVHSAPVLPVHPRPLPASVPILVIGGDLDDLTPLSDAKRFAPSLGARVRVVDLPNTVHVTSEGDTELSVGAACARAIIRRFLLSPDRLRTLSTHCARRIPHVHTAGAYPETLAAAAPADLLHGRQVSLQARRAVTVAAGAFADAVAVSAETGRSRGLGLHGGQFTLTGDHYRLTDVRFVTDATVTGAGTYRSSTGAVRATGTVQVHHRRFVVQLSWTQTSRDGQARLGDARLSFPAP